MNAAKLMRTLEQVKNTARECQVAMKQKLTITVDAKLLPAAKRYARSRGVSLSSLVEQSLRQMAQGDTPSFSARWRGKFRAAEREDDSRYGALAKKYLQ